jgi:predicted small secreted protein
MSRYILCLCVVLSACDTMNGLGQDTQTAAGSHRSTRATESKYGSPPPPPPYSAPSHYPYSDGDPRLPTSSNYVP